MLHYPSINPVAFHCGPLPVHWYGVMYLLGFLLAGLLANYRISRGVPGRWLYSPGQRGQVADLIFYGALGVMLGGRIGYMLFYDAANWVHHPFLVFQVWDGGMSFHGGVIGVVVATWIYARVYGKSWIDVIDFVVPLVPLGLAAGRVGNFINGELWGRITSMPWGMIYPQAGPFPRHPSQCYEFFLEGIVLFAILWIYSAKARPRFAVTALFCLLYGCMRFFVEFFREPDPQWGYLAWNWLTMGQLLSLPMILLGLITFVKRGPSPEN